MLRRRYLLRLGASARQVSDASSGDKLLSYWQDVLSPERRRGPSSGPVAAASHHHTELDVKKLMQTALRVRQGRVPGLLPEQMAGMLISFYKTLHTAERRTKFFKTLTAELGVDGARTYLSSSCGHSYERCRPESRLNVGGEVDRVITSWNNGQWYAWHGIRL